MLFIPAGLVLGVFILALAGLGKVGT
jgi:hypothetical protein